MSECPFAPMPRIQSLPIERVAARERVDYGAYDPEVASIKALDLAEKKLTWFLQREDHILVSGSWEVEGQAIVFPQGQLVRLPTPRTLGQLRRQRLQLLIQAFVTWQSAEPHFPFPWAHAWVDWYVAIYAKAVRRPPGYKEDTIAVDPTAPCLQWCEPQELEWWR